MGKIDALIVGAGPTGLMLACELIRYGLTCRIIDKALAPSSYSKAIAIQARTLELLNQAGLAAPFLDRGIKIHGASIFSNQECIARLHLEHIKSPYPFVLSIEQSQTEEILTRHLASLGVRIERESELTGFTQFETHIEANVTNAKRGSQERIVANWLIGCDGAHSIVRKEIGATFKGKLFGDVFSLADVEILWDLPHDRVTAFMDSRGVMAALPLPEENRYRLIFQMERCRDLLKKNSRLKEGIVSSDIAPLPTLDEVRSTLKQHIGKPVTVQNPLWLANFHINSRLADKYQSGRVFLAGDAAHIHSPVGGQGMNTGIQDAVNLAWKFAFVQKYGAKESLLETYEIERKAVGERLLKLTERASSIVTLHNPILIGIRNFIMGHIAQYKRIQEDFTAELSELCIKYPHSPLNQEHGTFFGELKPGDRAPDGLILSHNQTSTLFELFKNTKKGILLIFAGNTLDLAPQLESLANEFEKNFPVETILICANPYSSNTHQVAIDPDLLVHDLYGVDEPALYFIRPDLYVGYRQIGLEKHLISDYFTKWHEIELASVLA